MMLYWRISMPSRSASGARLRVGADVEGDDRRARGGGERHVGFGDAADAGVNDAGGDFRRAESGERLG